MENLNKLTGQFGDSLEAEGDKCGIENQLLYFGEAALCWSSHKEIHHVQGKRNPSKTVGVARGHQRADTLKPESQKTSQSDHRTTALSNSVELSHAM